jgi:myosin-18
MIACGCLLRRVDNLQQTKARLELSNQTLKQQHSKELEGREEELEQVKVTLNKKLKSMSKQLDEVHEEKQMAVKVSNESLVGWQDTHSRGLIEFT